MSIISSQTAIDCIRHLISEQQNLSKDDGTRLLLTKLLNAAISGKITLLTGGKNNTTFLLSIEDREVLFKIFGAHQGLETIENAHQVVIKLSEELKASHSTFKLPIPIALNAKTAHSTPLGLCAVYPYLAGRTPEINSPEKRLALGSLVGQLSMSLARLTIHNTACAHTRVAPNLQALEDRYTALPYRSHPIVMQAIKDTWLKHIDTYLMERIPELDALPCQLIHGDINASNLLEGSDGQLSAILDFEFTTYDTAVMELAVALASHGTDPDGTLQWGPILSGYLQKANLSDAEQAALPALVLLRRYDVVLHFIRRYGLEHPEVTHYLELLRQCWNSLIAKEGKAQTI